MTWTNIAWGIATAAEAARDLVRMLRAWMLGAGVAALCVGLSPAHAATAPASAAASAAGDKAAAARAFVLRGRIEKFKEWGGHSMVPRKVVNMNTFRHMQGEVAERDADALVMLAVDDDYGVRSLASRLLECVSTDAPQRLEAALAAETRPQSRSRLSDALTDIAARQAGGTSCRPAAAAPAAPTPPPKEPPPGGTDRT